MDARVTVVLPTFDRRHVLERTLPAYLALAARFALLVVDDGSHDGTAAWLETRGVRVVRHPRRRGLPAARNTGLRAAETPWVLFGEDDVLFADGYAEKLLTAAARLPRAAAVAGQLYAWHDFALPASHPPPSPRPLIDAARRTLDFAAALDRPRPLPSLHACALVARDQALAIGGYDERFADSAFREESDFYARLWRHGGACWLVPDAWAVHVRHRLGGGCRGAPGIVAKLRNRWSYWRNDSRFLDRHHRLWARWAAGPPPGRSKAGYALRLAHDAIAARAGA